MCFVFSFTFLHPRTVQTTFSKVGKTLSKFVFLSPTAGLYQPVLASPLPAGPARSLCLTAEPAGAGGGQPAGPTGLFRQLFHVNDDCTGVSWSVLVLGARCQRGVRNSFNVLPGARPLAEGPHGKGGETPGQGGFSSKDPAGSLAASPSRMWKGLDWGAE